MLFLNSRYPSKHIKKNCTPLVNRVVMLYSVYSWLSVGAILEKMLYFSITDRCLTTFQVCTPRSAEGQNLTADTGIFRASKGQAASFCGGAISLVSPHYYNRKVHFLIWAGVSLNKVKFVGLGHILGTEWAQFHFKILMPATGIWRDLNARPLAPEGTPKVK